MKATDLSLDDPQSMLFKGSPAFGKTLAAASFALDGPVHLAYWDKKRPIELMTYFTKARFGEKAEQILDNITFELYGADNANEYLNFLIELVEDCRYFACINDSVTTMTASCVNWSLNFGSKGKVKKKIKDILPDFDEYKVETSIITNCMDLSKKLPCHVIWTAHPVPSIKVEGSGSSMRVTKTNPIVSYGSKVAGIIPGGFTEIYHFMQQANWSTDGANSKKFMCSLESMGDDYAKSPLLGNYYKELEFTNKLFYEVWKEAIRDSTEKLKGDGVHAAVKIQSEPTQQWKPNF